VDLKESVEIEAPAHLVWSMLRDPRTVAECFPGARLGRVDGDVHVGSIVVKFGPTTVSFQGQAEIEYQDADRTVTINARGRDGRGATRASASVTATARDSATGGTLLEVAGDVDVVGPLAQFARTGGVFVTRQLLRDFGTAIGTRALSQEAEPAKAVADAPAPEAAADPVVAAPPAPQAKPVSGFSVIARSLIAWFTELFRRSRQERRSP